MPTYGRLTGERAPLSFIEAEMQLTEHARARSTQRSIPAEIVKTIFFFGTQRPAPGKAVRIMLDKTSIALAADGSARKRSKLERYRGAYLVVGDEGRIVTAAWRNRRFFN
jgi:hypothetical protein